MRGRVLHHRMTKEILVELELGSAPAQRCLDRIERHNAAAGHENAGFLSAQRGFLPLSAPRTRLEPRFAPWDELADELPALHFSLELRSRIERLPLLDASQAYLDDCQLLRAAALLAMLAHAYWYVETATPAKLPDALRLPWRTVRERLGRPQEVLSYIDLIVYNWRQRDPRGALELANLDLLLPTIGNEEERVFYLTQLEILARSSAIVPLTAAAQTAVARGDEAALEASLQAIAARIVDCTRTLPQIDPRPVAASYVDPVRWARTVAPFAVPMRRGDLGPSGTSSPLFNTLDVFFGRRRFESALGREILQLRASYPPAWRAYLAALQQLPIAAFVARSGRRSLHEAFRYALDCYAGERGFLGRHRAKVYGYLEIAFKVGRSLTIGGFSGPFAARTWDEVDDALASARSERTVTEAPSPLPAPKAAGAGRCYAWSEVARHNAPEHGYWLVVDDGVYDVTRFAMLHPGGPTILRAYAGMEASHGFARAHGASPRVDRLRGALRIGNIQPIPAWLSTVEAAAYRALVATLQLVVEMQNALEIDLSFSLGLPGGPTAYERDRARQRDARFAREYFEPLAARSLPRLHAALQRVLPELPALMHCVRPEAERGASSDRLLLHRLKRGLTTALRPFEQPGASNRSLGLGWLRCVAAMRQYGRSMRTHKQNQGGDAT